MSIKAKTFSPDMELPVGVVLPQQVHETKILEVTDGAEDLGDCDGIWTQNPDLLLGVSMADCAPVAVWTRDKTRHGIIHVGWRGLVLGIVEKMGKIFDYSDCQVWVGPMMAEFEIQKDSCYDQIEQKFGTRFFRESDGKIFFQFQAALQSVLPQARFDARDTFKDSTLASNRQDSTPLRNVTVVGRF